MAPVNVLLGGKFFIIDKGPVKWKLYRIKSRLRVIPIRNSAYRFFKWGIMCYGYKRSDFLSFFFLLRRGFTINNEWHRWIKWMKLPLNDFVPNTRSIIATFLSRNVPFVTKWGSKLSLFFKIHGLNKSHNITLECILYYIYAAKDEWFDSFMWTNVQEKFNTMWLV